jgi:hypothetical protein
MWHGEKGKKAITAVSLNPKWVAKNFTRKYIHKWIASKTNGSRLLQGTPET